MLIIDSATIRRSLDYRDVIDRMRDALIAQSRGECDTPMPMHLNIAEESAEVHMKSSYRHGGKYYVLKVASSFPRNLDRGLSAGNGMMFLASAGTGESLAILADEGHLTDVRTAAVSAMVARELGREDRILGILGTGIQARLQAQLHAQVLDLAEIVLWGRAPERAELCALDLRAQMPDVEVRLAAQPREVAAQSRLIVTCTAARAPLLAAADLMPGTHISAVGSDSPSKQELNPDILEAAALILADSLRQCERLGELQHAPAALARAVEIGSYAIAPVAWPPEAITVADFTGLGVEDLYIAESVYETVKGKAQ